MLTHYHVYENPTETWGTMKLVDLPVRGLEVIPKLEINIRVQA